MGILRKSCDPYNKLPSSLLFGSDFPLNSGILLDDMVQMVVVRKKSKFGKDIINHLHYTEWYAYIR